MRIAKDRRTRMTKRYYSQTATPGFMQAFRQAPWRLQVQRVLYILVPIALLIVLLSIYLSVTMQAADAGLEIQDLESIRASLQRDIANGRSRMAFLKSSALMEKRALEMGFQRVEAKRIVYMIVPGYTGKPIPKVAVPDMPMPGETRQLLKPVYTQSLWEWLFQGVLTVDSEGGGFSP
jgi:hypothetical protein